MMMGYKAQTTLCSVAGLIKYSKTERANLTVYIHYFELKHVIHRSFIRSEILLYVLNIQDVSVEVCETAQGDVMVLIPWKYRRAKGVFKHSAIIVIHLHITYNITSWRYSANDSYFVRHILQPIVCRKTQAQFIRKWACVLAFY